MLPRQGDYSHHWGEGMLGTWEEAEPGQMDRRKGRASEATLPWRRWCGTEERGGWRWSNACSVGWHVEPNCRRGRPCLIGCYFLNCTPPNRVSVDVTNVTNASPPPPSLPSPLPPSPSPRPTSSCPSCTNQQQQQEPRTTPQQQQQQQAAGQTAPLQRRRRGQWRARLSWRGA